MQAGFSFAISDQEPSIKPVNILNKREDADRTVKASCSSVCMIYAVWI
jgi:hypothetical protein